MSLYSLASTICREVMEEMENVEPCTTLVVYKTTRARMKRYQGRGVSADRFINDLMDKVFPQEVISE